MFQKLNSKMFNSKNIDPKMSDEDRLKSLISVTQEVIETLYNENNKVIDKCPKCGHSEINKNGVTQGRQRYICKKCRTTFDSRSFSPLSNTKLSLDKWLKYCQLMIEGGSIRRCADEVGVSIPTSFFMRHRILDVMNLHLRNEPLEGVVEMEACYINESFKGAKVKNDLDEKYFRHFLKDRDVYNGFFFNKIPFVENNMAKVKPNQICINTAMDKNGHILTMIVDNDFGATNNKVKPKNMLSFLKNMNKNTILCTFNLNTHLYRDAARNLGIKIKNVPRTRQPLYTVYNAYRCNWDLKNWLKNFNGVATKYLNNYLMWFKFLFIGNEVNRIKELFMELITSDFSITQEMIKNRVVESV